MHRALSIEDQAREVERVKRSHGWIVEDPLRIPRAATLREARETTRRHGVTGLLIEEERGSGVLAGLLSKRDMPWDPARDGDLVERHMTPFERLHVGHPGMSPDEASRVLYEHRIEKLPVVDGSRRILGLITKSDILLTRERPDSTKDAKGRLQVGAAVGARGDFLDRAEALLQRGGRAGRRHRARTLRGDGGGDPRAQAALSQGRARGRECRHADGALFLRGWAWPR